MKRLLTAIGLIGLTFFAQAAQAAWTTRMRITWTTGDSYWPSLAVDPSGHLHVVWYDLTPGNMEIYYKKSTDGGANWTASQRLTWMTGNSLRPKIASDSSGNLHLVWWNNTGGSTDIRDIYYKKSTNAGATWTSARRLTWTSRSAGVAIAVDSSGIVHLVWNNSAPGNGEIYYKKSADAGATWTPSQRLTWTADDSGPSAVAASSSGYLHVAWAEDLTPENIEVYCKRSTNGGTTWTTSQRLTWMSGWSDDPAIAADSSGNPHVVWFDDATGNDEIYHKKSTDNGANWTTSQRLTWNSGFSDYPALAADSSGNLHVVWEDGTFGNSEILYKKSTDSGAVWTTSERLTWSPGYSYDSAITADSTGKLYVVWDDHTPGNYEIFFKKST